MSGYWTSIFTEKTYKIWLEAGFPPVARFPESALPRVSRIKPQDFLLCYVSSPISCFVGLQKVKQSFVYNRSNIYGGNYPLEISVENEIILARDNWLKYTSLAFLPLMKTRDPERSAPSRGFIGQSAFSIDAQLGKLIAEAVAAQATPKLEIAPVIPIQNFVKVTDKNIETNKVDLHSTASDDEVMTDHEASQILLIKLGKRLGFDVWIAKNDKMRISAKTKGMIDNLSLEELPRLSGNKKVQNVIEMIDVLWLRHGDCEAAFEIECTTSVHSGLLRMSDLVTLQPNIATRMYIVAPNARREKVGKEIARPTFSQALSKPLSGMCRFISLERLSQLEAVPEMFWSSFAISVMDTVSERIEP